MKIINLVIILIQFLLLNSCSEIKKKDTNKFEKNQKNENVIYLGLSFNQAELILKSYNVNPLAYSFGDGPEVTSETYYLPTGKCLYLDWKQSETGFIICYISVSTKIYPLLVGKADPELNAFWDSFKDVKSFNLKLMQDYNENASRDASRP